MTNTRTTPIISWMVGVLGALVLLSVIISTAVSASATLTRTTTTYNANATGISSLHVNASATKFDVVFADVDQAELETINMRPDAWSLERRGDELRVDRRANWELWCWFGGCGWDNSHVILTLPEDLNDGGLAATLHQSAGELTADGDFKKLDLDISAGAITVTVSAEELSTNVSAGEANIDVNGVKTADLDVSAGSVDARLTGEPPHMIRVDVSAGEATLRVPDVAYDVTQRRVSAGELQSRVQEASNSRHKITVDLSTGSATILPDSSASDF